MPAATWDSAYLLKMFNRMAGRPTSDSITDALKYERLSEAQNEIIADLSAICPSALYPTAAYGSLPTMTTSDSQVFTFGTDANGYSKAPIGKVTLYRSLADIPTNPMQEGVDFIRTGATAVRTLNNTTLSGTIYWLGITNPADIDATVQPVLFPEASRELIPIRAAYNFGSEGNRNVQLMATMGARYGAPLVPGIPGRFAYWALTWKTQFKMGGALGSLSGMQLALSSQT